MAEHKSLKYSLAYAKGFEAMTCAWALAMTHLIAKPNKYLTPGWRELLDWHCLEEIEHRTIAFNVYQHVVGGYAYKVFAAARSQIHYLRRIHNVYRVMLQAKGFECKPYIPLFIKAGNVKYLNSFMPWYTPSNYALPAGFDQRLKHYEGSTLSQL